MNTKDEKVSKASDGDPTSAVQPKEASQVLDKVQMEKDGEVVAVEPWAVESKKGLGFVVIGTVDADGKVTATVVATPAHTFMTPEGFLKVIPDYYKVVEPKA